jgi:NAD-dependent deacetylase
MKKKLVVLTGAGISAESGLRTFRDSDGLWEGFAITDVATPGAFRKNPRMVLNFYNMRRHNVLEAQPNAAHTGLAALENDFDVHIITQNIDDLHERGGSSQVLHLHGEITKICSVADKTVTYPYDKDINVGDLAPDGHQLRPFIVWFEEEVPMLEQAARIVAEADILVVVGTSLVVYPAAGLLHFADRNIPKFIIDKKIPPVNGVINLTKIELPATEGVKVLGDLLRLHSH